MKLKFLILIISITLLLFSVLVYLFLKYKKLNAIPSPTIAPQASASVVEKTEVNEMVGQIVCIEVNETDMGEECLLGFKDDATGETLTISFSNKDLRNQVKVDDRIRLDGYTSEGEFGKKYLMIDKFTKYEN